MVTALEQAGADIRTRHDEVLLAMVVLGAYEIREDQLHLGPSPR
ncbi:MAG: hypothetical protein ACRDRP_05275 [Pseudonocardiaceae bacterium]